MPSTSAFELQSKIFKRMGLDAPALAQGRKSRRINVSRKVERKAQRVQKKASQTSKQLRPYDLGRVDQAEPISADDESGETSLHDHRSDCLRLSQKAKTTQKRVSRATQGHSSDDNDENDDELSFDGFSTDQDEPSTVSKTPAKKRMSRAVQERLAQDDAEIEDFEKKLGIKKGRKSLPKAFKDDGLDELFCETSEHTSDSDDNSKKRKREFEDWLASKRGKSSTATALSDSESLDAFEHYVSGSDDGDDEAADASNRPQQRENPYVAPTAGAAVAKYVPPSRRTTAASNDETRERLRKLIQGQINRLTDSNILSIVQAIEDIYQRNARGDVTELLTDAIMAQVCRTESLPDQFFVLVGGFSAAIYKVVGSSFGSHLIRRLVNDFKLEYDAMNKQPSQQKEVYNLVTFLTQLYVFQVVGCKIIFDYMEKLLSKLSDLNIELLLRVCRMAGKLLRRDDPQALRHVSAVVNRSLSKLGQVEVSVRTKFMIETINDLKNSKPKAKGLDSAIVSEHVLRMKKRLGDLKSQPRRLDGLAPMGLSLADVENADADGKWWLVGASVPTYPEAAARTTALARERKESCYRETSDEEDMDYILPDYPKKARAQGLGTTAQVAIFTALMTANDGEQGYQQYLGLRLKKDEQLEIARVLVQCVGSEADYNAYYAQVGRLACANGRVRFAFQDRLWKIFRSLGEGLFGEEADEEETAESERMKDQRRTSHVARFYASLVADGAMSITVLKPLELAGLAQRGSSFVERFLVSLLQACKGKEAKEIASVERVFGSARGTPALTAGIFWFLKRRVRKSRLDSDGRLERVRLKAQAVLQDAAADGGFEY
ncbi:hypothetical protein L249_7479 [Ophiocordyceps polyrhachis-furcata BCC 54312]|uniref:MI domain-containing protein n=1 Tax=Ophiocordyceps polyrhachis-furcata BCC 54312 TaxID=1330021 RepID=A0A367LA38_9HYPO|nr:hypothetical protein L249_7479 [Ophiocordyceps polyrhachis-furcata BCC 54312]